MLIMKTTAGPAKIVCATTMTAHPVQLHVVRAEQVPRIQVAVRIVLVVALAAVSSLIWVVAAIFALVMERIPDVLGDLLLFVLRLKYRLAAYHLSLVDRYPTLSEHGQGAGVDHALST